MENNLVNITVNDPIYQLKSKFITKHVVEKIQEARTFIETTPQLPIIATDTYYLYYSTYPMLRHNNPDHILEQVRQFYSEYMKKPEYRKLRNLTTLDDELSSIYSVSLLKTIIQELKKQLEKQMKKQGKGKQGKTPQQLLQQLIQQAQQGNKTAQQQLQQMISKALSNKKIMKQIMNTAVKKANQTTKNAKDIRDFMKGGKKAGKTGTSFEKILDLSEKIMRVSNAKEIISMGKLIIANLPKFTKIKKKRDRHGEELAGYYRTKKIERAIARELALPDDLFYAKLLGNGFLAKEKQTVMEGAYYVIIDKSGSMAGEKTIWARSVALALYKLAIMKGRKYFLRFFDTEVYPHGKPASDPEEVLELILTIESGGGTMIDKALRVALRDLRKHKLIQYTNTIILITDGEDDVYTTKEDLRDHGATLISIMIQGHNETLEKISDQYFTAKLTPEGALKLVREASR